MKIRLTPESREFYDLFSRASQNAVEIARLLVEQLERFPEGSAEMRARIKQCEHLGDELTHTITTQINKTFVTPFYRDDIYRLASALDDICDFVDESSGNFQVYGVTVVTPRARDLARVILQATRKLDEAVQMLQGFKDSSVHLIELRSLEDEGDRLLHEAIGELFRDGAEPLDVIRWKDIYEGLEEAVDSCENAADVLEAIIVKNR